MNILKMKRNGAASLATTQDYAANLHILTHHEWIAFKPAIVIMALLSSPKQSIEVFGENYVFDCYGFMCFFFVPILSRNSTARPKLFHNKTCRTVKL